MRGAAQDRPRGERGRDLPGWLPARIRLYIDHTEHGHSLRALARDSGLNPSTVLRHVRRCEARRDDPLMDGALSALGRDRAKERARATGPSAGPSTETMPDEARLRHEGRRLLQRLAEPGAVMAFSPEMERAVILRALPDGRNTRTAVLDRVMAQAFSLQEWIRCRKAGRVSTYEITAGGRAELRRLGGGAHLPAGAGLAEGAESFAGAPHAWPAGKMLDDAGSRRARGAAAETPIAMLARRRDRDGRCFLDPALVGAAEQLREDFELSRMGRSTPPDWSHFLQGGCQSLLGEVPAAAGVARARERVAAALRDLGPGLGDVALRVCCHLEGVESAEREMGWAARSGKIVLRIALTRLRRHYDETCGRAGPPIG